MSAQCVEISSQNAFHLWTLISNALSMRRLEFLSIKSAFLSSNIILNEMNISSQQITRPLILFFYDIFETTQIKTVRSRPDFNISAPLKGVYPEIKQQGTDTVINQISAWR